jgi:hypothetical protein
MASKPRRIIGAQAPPPPVGASDRARRFRAALADYANLAPESPYLDAIAAMVGGLVVPAMDVLDHGYGRIDIYVEGHWPKTITRAKSDRFEPPPAVVKMMAETRSQNA